MHEGRCTLRANNLALIETIEPESTRTSAGFPPSLLSGYDVPIPGDSVTIAVVAKRRSKIGTHGAVAHNLKAIIKDDATMLGARWRK